MTKATILGAGSWGTTVAAAVAARVETVLWARGAAIAGEINELSTNRTYLGERRLPETLRATAELSDALDGASLVIVAVPSHGARGVLEAAAPLLATSVPVLSLSKGIEHHSLLRVSEIVEACWGSTSIAVLTGPNLATEIFDGQPTASVVASLDVSLAEFLQDLLGSETMRIYTSSDVIGCEIAGAAKNVMAIATGMAVGLGLGDNTRAALITRALAETTRLGCSLGAELATFMGLAGVGDLVATCTSAKSRNFSAGVALGSGRPIEDVIASSRMVAEGIESCGPIVALARRHDVAVPVAEQVHAVCHGGSTPAATIPRLMARAPRPEFDTVARAIASPR